MNIFTLLGWVATFSFGLCYVPQIIKTYRRKEVADVSLWTWIIQGVGYTTGVAYGFHLKEGPLMFGYVWGWLCTAVFLILYLKYKGKKRV